MELDYAPNPNAMGNLNNLSFSDLERIKSQLDDYRARILSLQNAQSPLFRLPGELRNKILLFAMHGELHERKKASRHNQIFKQPAFVAVSRQIKLECESVWFNDVLIWEEFDAESKHWRRLSMDEVASNFMERSKASKVTLVIQPAHCDLGRTREGVEGSRSICPRKGLIWAKTEGVVLPSLRWWVW